MKKILFSLTLLLVTYFALELVAWAAHQAKYDDYNRAQLHRDKQLAISTLQRGGVYVTDDGKQPKLAVKQILHPYFGYTVDGKLETSECVPIEQTDNCLQRIKIATDGPFPKRSKDQIHIAITGGSFAEGFAKLGTPALIETLETHPHFANRKIEFYNLAAGGYKQPQHLTHLSFYYALGAELDFVINIDGFNEAATSLPAWRDRGLHPTFPADWDFRVRAAVTPEYLDLYAKRKSLRTQHAKLAKFTNQPPLRYSPLINFIWRLANDHYLNGLHVVETEITANAQTPSKRELALQSLGPDFNFIDWPNFHTYNSTVWANSSRAMASLSAGFGAQYFHFLQPNQYIVGSKPLSNFELNNAVLQSGGYGNIYREAHPYFRTKSQALLDSGVSFFDLTDVFAEYRQSLYVDNCCHINAEGNRIIGTEIGRLMLASMQ